ncbi:cytochrome b/b6 domain-containing protein [Vibrio sp. ZSDZ34]|uniref:Cytochrome b/b6 domain-containing protein n=1 Tax=Vibrio gelatinilyticus TaxID=2893468 RepID=A0A9X1W8T9_9VIBR|nr:cytochrome b/b6 domain-containing protein [Vibrio gelatinilyticus]MCJ2376402.1 cytochrome b/b6 domain-containing protein [Vibrio gelatinilyticus]
MNRLISVMAYWKVMLLLCVMSMVPSESYAMQSKTNHNPLHPSFILLDADKERILTTSRPLSLRNTCGQCHDVDFIVKHSDHEQFWQDSELSWDPIANSYGYARRVKSSNNEFAKNTTSKDSLDCLICHSSVNKSKSWTVQQFQKSGALKPGVLTIHKPRNENCAQCHGVVDTLIHQPLVVDSISMNNAMTLTSGQIISPQKVNMSGMNISDKEGHNRSFDVHSERVVDCVACHYSQNNPVFQKDASGKSEHLLFDPRRLTLSDYLLKPSHRLANTKSARPQGHQSNNEQQACESCHQTRSTHDWLPAYNKHFNVLACETCHVPKLFGPTLESVDWRFVDKSGLALKYFKNVDKHGLISPYSPKLMVRAKGSNSERLSPVNSVTVHYWQHGEPSTPVTVGLLRRALMEKTELGNPETYRYNSMLLSQFDRNRDGLLNQAEIERDRVALHEFVRKQLNKIGLTQVKMTQVSNTYDISHGIVNGQWVTKDCMSCHGSDSMLASSLAINSPGPTNYVIGTHRYVWIDRSGALLFSVTLILIIVHSLIRYKNRHNSLATNVGGQQVYMYDKYERFWHWLQATTIIGLLYTGLVIHLPSQFAWLSFHYHVQVHNILAAILILNAVFSLFYHVVSGEIRQYLPKPQGLFSDVVSQSVFYLKGIFTGAKHPFHKTKTHKLNPLQQVTYFAILNVLLPAQVATGLVIWAGNYWPEFTAMMGGTALLAPVHTTLAWLFASFIIMHIYLTTTVGSSPTAGIRSMVNGWEESEATSTNDPEKGKNTTNAEGKGEKI